MSEQENSEVIGEIRLIVKEDDIVLDSSFDDPSDIVYFMEIFKTAFMKRIVGE